MEKSPYSRRGGLSGKGQRARGKRGFGRPAAFGTRLHLEGDKVRKDETEMTEEELEQAQENARKYGRRDLGSNAHRYDEPEETEKAGSHVSPVSVVAKLIAEFVHDAIRWRGGRGTGTRNRFIQVSREAAVSAR